MVASACSSVSWRQGLHSSCVGCQIYRSSSSSSSSSPLLLGGDGGDGGSAGSHGLWGGFPPLAPPAPAAQYLGGILRPGIGFATGTGECGKSGMIGGRFAPRRKEGFVGVGGSRTATATFWISSCTLARCPSSFATLSWFSLTAFSRSFTLLWWSAAHISTLSWNITRCWFRAKLASPRNAMASYIRATWVAWWSHCTSTSWVRLMMASHTC